MSQDKQKNLNAITEKILFCFISDFENRLEFISKVNFSDFFSRQGLNLKIGGSFY